MDGNIIWGIARTIIISIIVSGLMSLYFYRKY